MYTSSLSQQYTLSERRLELGMWLHISARDGGLDVAVWLACCNVHIVLKLQGKRSNQGRERRHNNKGVPSIVSEWH